MEERKVSESQVLMTEMVLPSHTNAIGTAFGGTIMSWIDIAGAVAGQRHSRQTVVTANIDDLHFVAPVYQGWIVSLRASVNRVFNSSMEIGVRIDAENPKTGEYHHTATAYLTFVALNSYSKPVQIPIVVPETDEEKRRYEQAEERRQLRLKSRQLRKK